MSENTDAGFDDWLDAVDAGDPYYLECVNEHGSLPPRRVCPDCGSTDLTEQPLPETGDIEVVTITHVGTPSFEDDAPFAVAIVDFGPVRLTGQVRGTDFESIDRGLTVSPSIATTQTNDERLLVFHRA